MINGSSKHLMNCRELPEAARLSGINSIRYMIYQYISYIPQSISLHCTSLEYFIETIPNCKLLMVAWTLQARITNMSPGTKKVRNHTSDACLRPFLGGLAALLDCSDSYAPQTSLKCGFGMVWCARLCSETWVDLCWHLRGLQQSWQQHTFWSKPRSVCGIETTNGCCLRPALHQ